MVGATNIMLGFFGNVLCSLFDKTNNLATIQLYISKKLPNHQFFQKMTKNEKCADSAAFLAKNNCSVAKWFVLSNRAQKTLLKNV